jgi:hypothetical protein
MATAPPVPAPAARRVSDPRADSRFVAMSEGNARKAGRLKHHKPLGQLNSVASAAVRAPRNEGRGLAKGGIVGKVRKAPAPVPQPKTFETLLRARIAAVMKTPRTFGETDDFMAPEHAEKLTGALGGSVAEVRRASTEPTHSASRAPVRPLPDAGDTPLRQAPPAARTGLDAQGAMPDKAGADATDLSAAPRLVEADLAAHSFTPERLRSAGDPRFEAAASARDTLREHSVQAPASYRARETTLLAAGSRKAAASTRAAAAGVAQTHRAAHGRVHGHQAGQAREEEGARQQLADRFEAIYNNTKLRVEEALAALDRDAATLFDLGVRTAIAAMKAHVGDRLRRYKAKRYRGLRGKARRVRDFFVDLPDEVNVFYTEGRKLFTDRLDTLVGTVARLVEARLVMIKGIATAGEAALERETAGLKGARGRAAAAARRAFGQRFGELRAAIDDHAQDLADELARQYQTAVKEADAALDAIRAENRGLLNKAWSKLEAVWDALGKLKELFLSVLSKFRKLVGAIIDDPVGVLLRIVAALKGGFELFSERLPEHLRIGFFSWLSRKLGGATIPPNAAGGASTLTLLLQVMEFGPDQLIARAMRRLGAGAQRVAGMLVARVRGLFSNGGASLVDALRNSLPDPKTLAADAVKWLLQTVLVKAAKKIALMFVPLAGLIAAARAIYDIVMFLIDNARRLLELIDSLLDALLGVAAGTVAPAIQKINNVLGGAIPIAIDFLAHLLDMSDVVERVAVMIRRVKARVLAGLDRVIDIIVAPLKKLASSIRTGAKKLVEWWKKKRRFSGAGEQHTLQFDGSERSATLMVHTRPQAPKVFVQQFVTVKGTAADIAAVGVTDAKIVKTRNELTAAKAKDDEALMTRLSTRLDGELAEMTALLQRLLVASDAEGSQTNPVLIDYPKRRATAYVPIYAGPRVGEGLRLSQSLLGAQVGKSNSDAKKALVTAVGKNLANNLAFKAWTGVVEVYPPTAKKTLGNATVGLSPQFASLSAGTLLTYGVKGKTGGGGKINDRFKPYGFVPSSKGGEGLDGDHVLERQIGGPDELDNLWPLHRSENRSSGATVNSIKVKFKGKEVTVHTARAQLKKKPALYLLVRSTKG